nr:immunoglobulin light chain junction region [Macaca mulatta]
CMQDLDFPLTF